MTITDNLGAAAKPTLNELRTSIIAVRSRMATRMAGMATGTNAGANAAMDGCADLCADCAWMCYSCIDYCVATGHAECIRALKDCFDCCRCCSAMCQSKSDFCAACCKVCSDACQKCADLCRAVAGDETMQACAEACDECVEACMCVCGGTEARSLRAGKSETRSFHAELRAKTAEDGSKAPTSITGYPIVFGQQSEELQDDQGGTFREIVAAGAVEFAADVRADFNHSRDFILGRTTKGTLKLSVDAKGVFMDATAPDTQWARDLMTQIGRGDIDQGSFEFRVLPGGVTWNVDKSVRTLTKILVSRVSVVSDPAYSQTGIQVRALGAAVVVGMDADLMLRSLDLRLQEV